MSIAGAALTVGSTVANTIGANKAAKARDEALAAERIRQGAYDQEAQALNRQSQDRYQDFGAKTEEKKQALGDYFAPAVENSEVNNAAAALPATANNVVTREMAKRSGEARAFTDQQGQALASLRAFGDMLGDTSRMQGRDASLVGQIGGFKRGSSNVMPLELEAAAQRGSGARMLGDIMGGIGGIALTAGLTGGSLGKMFGGGTKPLTAVGRMPATARAGTTVARSAVPTLYPQQFTGIY